MTGRQDQETLTEMTSGELADNDIPVTLAPGEEDEDNDFIEDPFVGRNCG